MALPAVNITIQDGALGIVSPSVANVQLKIGTCSVGTSGTIYPETDPTQAVADLGYGPLAEACVTSLNVAGGLVYCLPVTATTAGVAGGVSHAGTGTATLAVTGVPFDAYQVVVKVTTGGAPGTAKGQISLDNGVTYQPVIVLNTSAINPSHTGLTLTFSGSGGGAFVLGDTYTFACTAPIMSSSDITTAITTALADPRTWGFLHIVGAAATVANSATIATAVDAAMQAAATTSFRYIWAIVECPQDTDANILSGFAAFTGNRTMVTAGFHQLTSPVGVSPSFNRNVGFSVAARTAAVPISESLGRLASGSCPGVISLVRNEGVTPGLDAAGFTTMTTYVGLGGFYITRGHMFVASTSDYTRSQNRRVMDVACAVTYTALLHFLEETLDVQATGAHAGALTDQQAEVIEAFVGADLASAIIAPNYATAASVVALQNNNLLVDSTVYVQTRITPKGYAETIKETIGFFNPALQLQAAA